MSVMLAHTVDGDLLDWLNVATGTGEWAFEPKLDGMRVLYRQEVDGSRHWESRTGKSLNDRFRNVVPPEIEGAVTLDGEMVAFDAEGRTSFNQLQKAHGRIGDPTPSFIAFDILRHPDQGDVEHQPWVWRKELLEGLRDSVNVLPHSFDGPATWAAVQQYQLEGVMAKRIRSQYTPGRSDRWRKLKATKTISAIVMGFKPGEGGRASTFGALHLGLFDGDPLDGNASVVRIGEVGSGFTQADLRHIVNLPHPFVVDVAYQEWTGEALRFPVFKGVRPDVDMSECTFTIQLPQ